MGDRNNEFDNNLIYDDEFYVGGTIDGRQSIYDFDSQQMTYGASHCATTRLWRGTYAPLVVEKSDAQLYSEGYL